MVWLANGLVGVSYYKWSRTVYGRIIGPPWDHPRRRKQSPLTVTSGPPVAIVHCRQSTMKRGSIYWSLSDTNRTPVMHDTRSQTVSILQIQQTCIVFQVSLGIHYADSSSMGVVSSPPPAETSADVASPCFDRTGSVQAILHMQVLWQRQLRKGCCRQQGGTSYGCDIWSRGDRLFCRGQPGETTFEGGLSTA